MNAAIDRKNDPWEKISVSENIYCYRFHEREKKMFNGIFVLVDSERAKALILDAAYPEYAEKVKKDLENSNIQPELVVLSHYHPDHSAGAGVFNGLPLYASQHYQDNHFNCQRWEPEYTYLHPGYLINDGDLLSFGRFQLEFIEAPGHSGDMMLTSIDKQLIHIGDLLMFGSDGRPTLPYVSMGGSFKQHITSLERLKTMEYQHMLIPHGPILSDRTQIIAEIDDRIHYLKRMLDTQGTLPVEKCIKNDAPHYAHTEYHAINQMSVQVEL